MFSKDKSFFSYLIKCILHMNFRGFFQTVNAVHRITQKNRLVIILDMIYCGVKYGAACRDYYLCEFYLLNREQRATYVTRAVNNKITSLMNDRAYYHFLDNKDEFYSYFPDLIGRSWMSIENCSFEEFKKFMENRDEIVAKPSNGTCGAGVEILKKSDFMSDKLMFRYLTFKNSVIIEDVIRQHEDLETLYPGSINTLRIVTIFSGGKANIVYAFIRIGNSERPVDNINAGGMCAPIDIGTGVVTHDGYDKNRVTYITHPKTGRRIKGFRIPMWREALRLCETAAERIPQMGYIGWDVAVTPNGPVLVEGNNLPGHDILQMPPHVPERIGMLPRFKMFVNDL